MLVTALDSYFSYVSRRLAVLGATVQLNGKTVPQPVGGLSDAIDWPQTQVVEGAVYLLHQRTVPGGRSTSQQQYLSYVQWVWMIFGSDIGSAQQASNRGDRYRQNMQIQTNLKEANYPGFCQKILYSADDYGVVSGVPVVSAYPAASEEWLKWNAMKFMPRMDTKDSGVTYGAATTEIGYWEDTTCAESINQADVAGPQVLGDVDSGVYGTAVYGSAVYGPVAYGTAVYGMDDYQ